MRQRPSPGAILDQDHERIGELLTRLVVMLRADDREESARLWTNVEDALLRHFDVEEMFVFPVLAEAFPADVAKLRDDHAEMRHALGEIGLAFDIHAARCEPIEAFCARLREHAAREAAIAYREAENRLSERTARSLIDRLRKFARSKTPAHGVSAVKGES